VTKAKTCCSVDNIYRYTLAGTEVSALLGRMPSAVGYQPTLAEEMGRLQERITSTKVGSITSIQAVYVPADDLTDPSPATTFAHLDSTVVLSRDIASLGIYPAVDPLDSTSRQLDPLNRTSGFIVVGANHQGIELSTGGIQRVHRRIDTQRSNITRQHHGGVQVGEGGGRRRIGQVIGWHVNGLDRRDRADFGGRDPLL